MLRCLVFIRQLSIVNALSKFIDMKWIGYRYLIQYIHLKGLSPTNIKAELDFTLAEPVLLFTIIKYWVAEFKQNRTNCQDKHRSGQPNKVTMTETVKKIHKMVLDKRRLKVHKRATIVGISKHTEIAYWLKIWTWKICVQDEFRVCSQWNKNSVMRMFQLRVWWCFTAIKLIFCVDS